MSTEEELVLQLEELRKKKDLLNKENEFVKQRNYLINKFKDFVEIDISEKEIIIFLLTFAGETRYYFPITTDNYHYNLLLIRKFYNKYAKYHEIRYEDSVEIIEGFLHDITPLDI